MGRSPAWDTCFGYARVSTTDQQPGLQVDALERAGCYRVFTETAGKLETTRVNKVDPGAMSTRSPMQGGSEGA